MRDGDVSGGASAHAGGSQLVAMQRWRRAARSAGPLLRRPSARRSAWVLVDQGVSSVTNFLAAVLVARAVSASSFGAFSVALIVYTVVVSVARALVSQPLAITASAQSEQHGEVAAAAGAAIFVGCLAGAVTVCIGVVVGGPVGAPLTVTGVLLPGLVLQDTWRFALFTVGQPARAVVNDLTWAGGLVVLVALVLIVADGSATALTGAWAGAAAIAAVLGAMQTHVVPLPAEALGYLRRHFSLGWRFSAEALFNTGGTHVTMLVIAANLGAAGVGAIRGGLTLFGPFIVIALAVGTGGIAEASRLLARSPNRVLPVLAAVSGSLVVVGVGWGTTLLALPPGWGRAVLGDTWSGARDMVVPLTVGTVGVAAATGALLGLRIVAAASATMRLAALSACVNSAAGVAGAAIWGAPGVAWGFALGGWTQGLGAWLLLRRFCSDHPGAFSRLASRVSPDSTPVAAAGGGR